MIYMTCLSDETTCHDGAAIDGGSRGDNKIFCNHIASDINRVMLITVDAPVLQFHCPGNPTVTTYPYILDITHIHYHAVMFDGSSVGGMLFTIKVDDRFHPLYQYGAMSIE